MRARTGATRALSVLAVCAVAVVIGPASAVSEAPVRTPAVKAAAVRTAEVKAAAEKAAEVRAPVTVEPWAAGAPLAGKVVVIDPGHQLGNSRHLTQVNKLVDAGGFKKACNTSGTQTDSGYPESTFAFSTARYLKARLEAAGAEVRLTRTRNSVDLWGPCIDVRGRYGNKVGADAVVSIHADGGGARYHGFFVIRPADRAGWTDDVYPASRRLSLDVRAGLRARGLPYANYYGGDGLDTRGDLGTLNWSDVPIVMVELGNMRNATDAAHMKSASWRSKVYAAGLAAGLTRYLTR